MNRQTIIEKIKSDKLIAIVRGIEKEKTLAAVAALHKAGLKFFEVTFNTPGAIEIITTLNATYGDELYIGAGTVLDEASVHAAFKAGAKFILSPDTDEQVIKASRSLNLISIPGALSPTEVRQAIKFGGDIIKIFPAGAVGPDYIKDLLGPLNTAQLMAVGGVGLGNANAFIQAGAIAVGVGGTLFDKKILANDDMSSLIEHGKRFIKALNEPAN